MPSLQQRQERDRLRGWNDPPLNLTRGGSQRRGQQRHQRVYAVRRRQSFYSATPASKALSCFACSTSTFVSPLPCPRLFLSRLSPSRSRLEASCPATSAHPWAHLPWHRHPPWWSRSRPRRLNCRRSFSLCARRSHTSSRNASKQALQASVAESCATLRPSLINFTRPSPRAGYV